MAYTDRFYSDPFTPKKRSDRGDLLNDVENTFYGGGQVPRPTATPTPTPKPVSLAMLGQPTGVLNGSQNAASRVNQTSTGGSRFIGKGGIDLGPLYDDQGGVNPLPRGAVGAQGSPVFNRSLNGAQPSAQTTGAAGRMTHTEMASDIAKRNLTAQGSLLGAPQQDTSAASRVPDATEVPTVHFLPPGFSSTVGSTGVPGSTPNDIHFLPPGFSSVSGFVGKNKQLQTQSTAQSGDVNPYSPTPIQYPTVPGGNINFNVPGGSMQGALQQVAPPGMDYSASTGQYIPSSTPGLVSTVKGQAPVPRKPDEGYGSAYGY